MKEAGRGLEWAVGRGRAGGMEGRREGGRERQILCQPSTSTLYIMSQPARAVHGARTVNETAAVATLTRYATKPPDVRSVLKASRAATVTRTSMSVSPATRVTNTPTVATQSAHSNVSAPPDLRSTTPRPVKVRLDTYR